MSLAEELNEHGGCHFCNMKDGDFWLDRKVGLEIKTSVGDLPSVFHELWGQSQDGKYDKIKWLQLQLYIEGLERRVKELKEYGDEYIAKTDPLLSCAADPEDGTCGDCRDCLWKKSRDQEIEIARLKSGKFTPEEFNNLCHETALKRAAANDKLQKAYNDLYSQFCAFQLRANAVAQEASDYLVKEAIEYVGKELKL